MFSETSLMLLRYRKVLNVFNVATTDVAIKILSPWVTMIFLMLEYKSVYLIVFISLNISSTLFVLSLFIYYLITQVKYITWANTHSGCINSVLY